MDRKVIICFERSDLKKFYIDGKDWDILSDGLEGFGSFENEIQTVAHGRNDGGIIVSEKVAAKDRTITVKSRNPLLNEVLRKHVLSFFRPKYLYKVSLTYMGVTRWFEGKIYKFDLDCKNIYRPMTMLITFLCPDPYLRSKDNFGKNIAEVVGMCGFPYLCNVSEGSVLGVTAGRYHFAKKVLLENDGDVSAYCKVVFTASGEVKNPKLMMNGHFVRVNDTMQQGDVIIMDFTSSPPTIKKNGQNYIGHCDRASAFDEMMLPVGGAMVSFDAESGDNLLQVSIYYNKLYAAM